MTRLLARLNHLWRLIMTGLFFLLFGAGGLLLSLVWFNLLRGFCPEATTRRRLARQSIAASFRLFLRSARRVGVLDYRIDGTDLLRQDRGSLILANHPTLIDYVLLASVMPEAGCVVKDALRRNPFFSGVIRAADYLVNSQADTMLDACRARLDGGENIIIFPEGTRSRPGAPLTLQRGASHIAVRCGCPMRIVHICCSQHLLNKNSRWYDVPPEKPFFEVKVNTLLSAAAYTGQYPDEPSLAARQLNRHLQQLLTPQNA